MSWWYNVLFRLRLAAKEILVAIYCLFDAHLTHWFLGEGWTTCQNENETTQSERLA